jgi:hypothetical protein
MEALRGLIDAIEVCPGKRRGKVSVVVRGDLAAFLHLAEAGSEEAGGRNQKSGRAPGGEQPFW